MKLLLGIAALLIWFSLPIGKAWAQKDTSAQTMSSEGGGMRRARLYGIATSSIFDGVNPNDARVAMKVWFDIIGQQKGYILQSKIDIVDSLTEIRQRFEKHSVDLALLGITDYLELESSGLLMPFGTEARNAQGEELYSFVLLVNSSSSANTIASLRGKTILVGVRGSAKTGAAWLDILLSAEKLGRAASFFASVRASDKPQACILPLFFGTVDACVVDEVSLNLAKEMNPQLGRLKVLARSRPIIESVLAFPAEASPYQKEMIDGILTLHQDPRGRQLLMVFKTDRIVRVQLAALDSVRQLWSDYNKLPGSSPYRPLLARAQGAVNPSGLGK